MSLILQLDSQGQPTKWITWQTAVIYHAKNQVSWSMGEFAFTFHGGDNRVTGKQSVITTSSIIALKGNANSAKRRYKTPTLGNRELFSRDRHMCAYCGGIFSDNKLSADHILPTSRGGQDVWMNVVTACGRCNQKKDDKTPEEAGMQLLYVPYIPSAVEHLLLKNRSVLTDQMEFLLKFVPDNSRIKREFLSKHQPVG